MIKNEMIKNEMIKKNIVTRFQDESLLASGCFAESDCKLFYYDRNDKKIQIANFLIFLRNEHEIISAEGEEWFMELLIYSNFASIPFTIKLSDFTTSLYEQIHQQYPYLYISTSNRGNVARFYEYISILYGDYIVHRRIQISYNLTGWHRINGFPHYFSGVDNNSVSPRYLCNTMLMNQKEVFIKGLEILKLADLMVILPLYLQMHMGVIAQLFDDVGNPLRHIMTIAGPTGSRKTALARELFCNFESQVPINFTATDRALEIMLEKSKDLTMLLDDLYSANDPNLLAKLQRLMRQYCDGTGRCRSYNFGQDIEQKSFCCSLVMTAESNIENIQISSKRRLFIVPIEVTSVNNEMLRVFQENRSQAAFNHHFSWVEVYLSCFIQYVERNYEHITNFIVMCKSEKLAISSDRLAYTYKALFVTAAIIIEWGRNVGMEMNTEAVLSEWLEVIKYLVYYNEKLCMMDEPYLIFLEALNYGVASGELRIAISKYQFEEAVSYYIGFIEKDNWKIDLHKVYEFALRYGRERGFLCSEKEIARLLYEKGLTEVYVKTDRISYLKRVRIKGADLPMLCIKRHMMEQVLKR